MVPAGGTLVIPSGFHDTPKSYIAVTTPHLSIQCNPGSQINMGPGTTTSHGVLEFSGTGESIIGCTFANPSGVAGSRFVHILATATSFFLLNNTFDGASLATGAVWWDGKATNLGIINGVSRRNTYSHFGVVNSQSAVAEQVDNPTNFLSQDEAFSQIAGDARHFFVLGETPRTDEGATFTVRGGNCTAWENFCLEVTDYNYASYLIDNVTGQNPQKSGAGVLSITTSPALTSGVASTANSGTGGAVSWVSGSRYCTTCGWVGQTMTIAGYPYTITAVFSTTRLTVLQPTGTQTKVATVQPYNVPGTKVSSGTISNNHGFASYDGKSISTCFELDVQNALITGNSCVGNAYGIFSYNGGNNRIIGNYSSGMYGIAIQFNPSWIGGDSDVIQGNVNINSCIGDMQVQAHTITDNYDLRNPGSCAADTTPLGRGHSPYTSILYTRSFASTDGILPPTNLDGNKLVLGAPVGTFSVASNWGTDFDWYAHRGQNAASGTAEQITNENTIPLGYGWVGAAELANSVFTNESYTNIGIIGDYPLKNSIHHSNNQVFAGNNQTLSFIGETKSNSQTIAVANTLGLVQGQVVAGTNIPRKSIIDQTPIANTSIHINQASTGDGSENLTATGPGSDFTIQGPQTSIPMTSAQCATGTGAGTRATCSFLYSSSPFAGILEVDTAGSPALDGTIVTITMPPAALPYFTNIITCTWGNASPGVVLNAYLTPTAYPTVTWNNLTSALSAPQVYRIAYTCLPTAFPLIQP